MLEVCCYKDYSETRTQIYKYYILRITMILGKTNIDKPG